jgi:hypothetical protein
MINHQFKKVSFDLSKNLIVVERMEGVWYTRQELALIRRRDHEILKKVRRTEFREGVFDSARGLRRKQDCMPSVSVVRAVLHEQNRQKSKGVSNAEMIARFSFMLTKLDRITAIETAFKDAIEANESRHNALPQISAFRLISAHDHRQSSRVSVDQDQFLDKIQRKDLKLTSSRQIRRTPSLRKAFSKTLSGRKCGAENERREYRFDTSRESKVLVPTIFSLPTCNSKHAFIDSDEATERTMTSCSTIDCC